VLWGIDGEDGGTFVSSRVKIVYAYLASSGFAPDPPSCSTHGTPVTSTPKPSVPSARPTSSPDTGNAIYWVEVSLVASGAGAEGGTW